MCAQLPCFLKHQHTKLLITGFIGELLEANCRTESSRPYENISPYSSPNNGECIPPPTMQTSTSSLSRSCCLGSNESSISASLRHGVVKNVLLQLTRALDLGLSNKHRRRAGANCEYAAVANLGALFDCVRARLARDTERGFGGILGAALRFRGSAWWDVLPRAFCHKHGNLEKSTHPQCNSENQPSFHWPNRSHSRTNSFMCPMILLRVS